MYYVWRCTVSVTGARRSQKSALYLLELKLGMPVRHMYVLGTKHGSLNNNCSQSLSHLCSPKTSFEK